jgi:hypothetical protein
VAEVRIDVTIDDGAIERTLARVRDALEPPSLTQSVGEGADEFVDAARAAAPVRSGRLRESIDKTLIGSVSWSVGPDLGLPYARIQEHGGHIYPRFAQALRFEIAGQVIFAKHVYIPGTHYMERGFDTGLAPAIAAVEAAVDRKIETG